MKKVFVSCPPMLAQRQQMDELGTRYQLELVSADVVQTLSKEELLDTLPKFDAWIAGDDEADADVLKHAHEGNLQGLVKWGIGVDNIDINTVKQLGIPFANTPGMFSNEVADIALGYLISLTRHIPLVDKKVREGKWIKPQGESLAGKTAGIVGLGNIGQALARRLKSCDISVVGYDPFVTSFEYGEVAAWPNKIEQVDYLFLCCALTDDNRDLINGNVLTTMKNSAYIVNVSRGPLIKQATLIEALKSSSIAGAALDVFEIEPLPIDSDLTKMDNVILGSHNASNTKEAVRATNERAVALISEMLE